MQQKGIVHTVLILPILILIIGIGIAVYLTQFTQIFKPKATENICTADSANSVRTCIAGISANQYDVIEITNLILCDNQTICNFELNNSTRPIVIRGAANSGAGFRRTQKYDYTFVNILHSNNITIQNLTFDDLTQACNSLGPPPNYTWTLNTNCNNHAQIAINTSNNITLDGITSLHAPSTGISVYKANGFVLKNSKIIDSGRLGVWIPVDENPGCVDCVSHSIHVDNNLFVDTSTEAILFGSIGTAQNPSTLNNNMFVHTHQRDIYSSGGGTLNLQRLSYAEIKGNVIYGNKIENTRNFISGGGELASKVDNLVISGNSIHDNSGGGLGLSISFNVPEGTTFTPPPGYAQNVTIMGNKLYNNYNDPLINQAAPPSVYGLAPNFPFMGPPTGNIFSADKFVGLPYFDLDQIKRDNCQTAECPGYAPVKMGKIYADPATCLVPNEQSQCSTIIKWHTHDGGNVQVKVSAGSQLNQPLTGENAPKDGEAAINWITLAGARFDLYIDGQVFDSVYVKGSTGTPATTTPTLTPTPSANTPPIGYFDGIDTGRLVGWGCDADTPSTAISVHVYIDDQFGWVARADQTGEAGIAPYCGGYKDRRVITEIPVKYRDGKAHQAKMYAIDNVSPGTNTLFNGSPRTFTIQPPPPTGTLTASPNPCQMTATQSVCTSAISWNVTNPGTGRIIVKVRSSGAELGGEKPIGSADATGISTAGETLDLYSGTTLLSSITVRGVRVNSSPIGIFDGVFGTQLIGWACDLDTPSAPINVEYSIDDQAVAFVLADKPGAAGIASNCGGFPNRRFVIDIPNQYKDGKPHTVKVSGVDNVRFVASTLLNGSPKTFNLPAPKKGDLSPTAGGDGNVDMADFNIFARYYKDKDLRADFNGDSDVTLADLNILIRNFGH